MTSTWEAANAFLIQQWVPFHNRTWRVDPNGEGSAFVPYTGDALDRIFAQQHERVVGNDNCVEFEKRHLQIPKSAWRLSYAKCRVKVYERLDETLSIGHGPHILGYYDAQGSLLVKGAGGTEGIRDGREVGSIPATLPVEESGSDQNRTDHLL